MRRLILLASVLFLTAGVSVFSQDAELRRTEWLERSRIGIKIELGAHTVFNRDLDGFIPDENAMFLYVTSLQPETYEEAVKDLSLTVDRERITSVLSELKDSLGLPYMIFPAKNYDGFCFWDSAVSDYNIADHTVTQSDWLKTVSDICREFGVKVGYTYSIIDWHHPSQIQYRKDGTRFAVKMNTVMNDGMKQEYIDYMTGQLRELIVGYGADLIWFDGNWAPWWTPEDAEALAAEMRRWNPDLIINSLQESSLSAGGDFDVYTVLPSDLTLKTHRRPWLYSVKSFTGIDQIANSVRYRDSKTLIEKTVKVWGKGGSVLIHLNVTKEALVAPAALELMKETGEWLAVNREAIFGTMLCPEKTDSDDVFFCGDNRIYRISLHSKPWSNGRKPLKIDAVPYLRKDAPLRSAFLFLKNGKAALEIAEDTEELLLLPEYRDEYESLLMPVYGFEY